jgi:hypothetical protein
MYDPVQTLHQIDAHKWPILVFCSLAMICNYAWFFSAYRQANRDRTYSIPVFCSCFWLAGDGTVVLNFDRAFNTYDHWYPKLFWVALTVTVAFEIAFLVQTIRYGHKELLPEWTRPQFAALVVGGAVVAAILWGTIQSSFNDDLFIVYFHLANVTMPIFYVGMLLRRRSTAGTNTFIWKAYLAMETLWYAATFIWFGSDFRGIETVGCWVATTVGCLGMIWALGRLPRVAPHATEALVEPPQRVSTVGALTPGAS